MSQTIELRDRLTRFLDRGHHASGISLKDTAGLGHGHLLSPTVEQNLSQLALELDDVFGERRL